MLSRIAREFAAEIAKHDFSDSPWRIDRAGHDRRTDTKSTPTDKVLDPDETDRVKWNNVVLVAQVLKYSDPNFDLHEFAVACGLPRKWTHTSSGRPSGIMTAGLRTDLDGSITKPGEDPSTYWPLTGSSKL